MSALRDMQPSFTAGELSPALGARVDLAKYASGLKAARNVFVHPHGGVSNRAGTEFIDPLRNQAIRGRLVGFEFGQGQSYALVMNDGKMRVYKQGALVLTGGLVPFELTIPWTDTELAEIVWTQEADVMYITHVNHAPQKLSRLADNNWTLAPLNFVPTMAAPGALTGSGRYKFRNGTRDSFQFGITAVSAGGAESLISSLVVVVFQYDVFDGRYIHAEWNASAGAASYRMYRTNGSGANQGLVAETSELSIDLPPGPGLVVGDGVTFEPGVADPGSPPTPTGVIGSAEFGTAWKYVVSAINEDTGEESLPSPSITLNNELSINGNTNRISWAAVPNADAYIVYKMDNGLYGFIGRTENTFFVDDNITADISDGPQQARNPFDAANKYPRASTFIEQRLAFGGSNNEPQAVWMSQSGNYENFNVSQPAKASDAVTFRIRARQVNKIYGMLPMRGLMLLTSGAEWIVTGGSQSDAISPSSIKVDNQGYRGSSIVQPIVVGNTVLFAQGRGGVVRDFSYQFANDGFTGKDLTILARHLFETKAIVAWAYAQAPYSMAWTVLNDGTLVSLTYIAEQDVWAWTRHDSSEAFYEDVVVIAEGDEDVPYFIVRRTIDGGTKRYIERLHTRVFNDVVDAFFVDCGLTYDGAPVTVLTGLLHLKNRDVVALADGDVVRNLTVSAAGEVTLPRAASKVHIGLAYEAAIATLNLDLGAVRGIGTVQGRMKSIDQVTLRVERTRGTWVGHTDGTMEDGELIEFKQRESENWDEAIGLYTGDIQTVTPWDWYVDGTTWVKQFDPLPMTVLAIMPDVTIGK